MIIVIINTSTNVLVCIFAWVGLLRNTNSTTWDCLLILFHSFFIINQNYLGLVILFLYLMMGRNITLFWVLSIDTTTQSFLSRYHKAATLLLLLCLGIDGTGLNYLK